MSMRQGQASVAPPPPGPAVEAEPAPSVRRTRTNAVTVLAWTQGVIAIAIAAATLALVTLSRPQDPAQTSGWPRVATPLSFLELWVIGTLIAARHRNNPIGWILCGGGLFGSAGAFATQYANVGLARGSLPGVALMAWFASLTAATTGFPCIIFGLLLFPGGHLLSRRWRSL